MSVGINSAGAGVNAVAVGDSRVRPGRLDRDRRTTRVRPRLCSTAIGGGFSAAWRQGDRCGSTAIGGADVLDFGAQAAGQNSVAIGGAAGPALAGANSANTVATDCIAIGGAGTTGAASGAQSNSVGAVAIGGGNDTKVALSLVALPLSPSAALTARTARRRRTPAASTR